MVTSRIGNAFKKKNVERKGVGTMEVTGIRGRRHKKLLVDIQETRGSWKFEQVTLDRNLWRARSGRGYGPLVRQLHNE